MPCMHKRFAAALLLFSLSSILVFAQSSQPAAPSSPKVRAVTAFIRMDRSAYRAQVTEALKLLHASKDALTKAGYEVETIRITPQPFPEYTRGKGWVVMRMVSTS